ncbi:60S acidic ribosomal protein P1-like [Carlito syrichta]|uniref:60S acidic ribosomal protein P1-like n=1 Tax=Carlito syrichta TaxID=1868482 RepID=A0A1U7T6G5_CARSF|nr:60S acidic ribosomal protein P1-like [Carlito syrichta]
MPAKKPMQQNPSREPESELNWKNNSLKKKYSPFPSCRQAPSCACCIVASVSELTCIYSALILHDDEVTITALANVNIGSLICSVGAAPARGPAPSTAAASAEEKKVEAKKEESEESDDDMGFGLSD